MIHQVSAKERSVINSGVTEDYKQAFVEYVWNGFDAGATGINKQFFKFFKKITITTNIPAVRGIIFIQI